MDRVRGWLGVAGLLGVLASGQGSPVLAHTQSQGHSRAEVAGSTVTITLWLRAEDLHVLAGMDPNEDGTVTEEEAAPHLAALSAAMLRNLQVQVEVPTGDRLTCTGTAPAFSLLGTAEAAPSYPFTLRFDCPALVERAAFQVAPMLNTQVRHVNLGTVVGPDGQEQQVVFSADGDPVVVSVRQPRALDVARQFGELGVEHIITGYDHLLFLLALLLGARRFRDVLAVVTAFTVAHSVTLAMAVLDVARAPGSVVEPAIALSIVALSAENLWALRKGTLPRTPRAAVAFAFGLLHGFGFAGALAETGVPPSAVGLALLSFNLGVECGQVAFCAVAFTALQRVRATAWSGRVSAVLGAFCVGMGLYWFLQRTLG